MSANTTTNPCRCNGSDAGCQDCNQWGERNAASIDKALTQLNSFRSAIDDIALDEIARLRAEVAALTARANNMEHVHVFNMFRMTADKSKEQASLYFASFVTDRPERAELYEMMAGSQLPEILAKLTKYSAWVIAKEGRIVQVSTDRFSTP